MTRTLFVILASVLLSACSLVGIRSGYEQPSYEVIAQLDDAVEVRSYAPRVAVEAAVEAPDTEEGRNEAFRLLFDYISGANRANAEISMTAPVETAPSSEEIAMTVPVETVSDAEAGTRMRFFLPAEYSAETAPTPTDARVRIVSVPAQTVAVLRFSGFGGEGIVAGKTEMLLAALEDTSYRRSSEPVAYFYDPPWTIPFFRRNEVVVAVTR